MLKRLDNRKFIASINKLAASAATDIQYEK